VGSSGGGVDERALGAVSPCVNLSKTRRGLIGMRPASRHVVRIFFLGYVEVRADTRIGGKSPFVTATFPNRK